MSTPAARLSDQCTGHGSFPPRPCVSASENVFINDLGSHRVGDMWAPHHRLAASNTHSGILITGSTTVMVNDLPKGRVGDMIDCGSTVMNGSPNVFVGG